MRMGSIWGAELKTAPKAKPLAELLVAEAAKQGATIEELKLAAIMARDAYEYAMKKATLGKFVEDAMEKLGRMDEEIEMLKKL